MRLIASGVALLCAGVIALALNSASPPRDGSEGSGGVTSGGGSQCTPPDPGCFSTPASPDPNPEPQAGQASDVINALGALSTGIGTLLTGAAAVLMARRSQTHRTPATPPPAPPATPPADPGSSRRGEGDR